LATRATAGPSASLSPAAASPRHLSTSRAPILGHTVGDSWSARPWAAQERSARSRTRLVLGILAVNGRPDQSMTSSAARSGPVAGKDMPPILGVHGWTRSACLAGRPVHALPPAGPAGRGRLLGTQVVDRSPEGETGPAHQVAFRTLSGSRRWRSGPAGWYSGAAGGLGHVPDVEKVMRDAVSARPRSTFASRCP